MLQLFADKVNMGRISKLLVKYNIKATVNDSTITIYGTIPEDLASQLYSNTQIIAFNNYDNSQGYVPIDATTVSGNVIKAEKAEMLPEAKPDVGEEATCKIVLPCTTQHKANLPVHYIFRFSSENMVDHSNAKVSSKINVTLGEAITTVSKSRLIEYLGTMTEYFNLETLSKKLSKTGKYTIEASEIQRLIVARVKERFRLKKSPTIDFIRLVNRLLTKKEEKQDENSI